LQFLLDRVRVRNLDEFIVRRFDLNVLTMRLHFDFTYSRIKVLADNYVANGRILSTPIVGRSGLFEMDFFGKRLFLLNFDTIR
jgi:Haemolymph juvenile hormone binding protein (JHBP)